MGLLQDIGSLLGIKRERDDDDEESDWRLAKQVKYAHLASGQERRPRKVYDLPRETMLHIVSFLDAEDIIRLSSVSPGMDLPAKLHTDLHNLVKVSRYFCKLTDDEEVWRKAVKQLERRGYDLIWDYVSPPAEASYEVLRDCASRTLLFEAHISITCQRYYRPYSRQIPDSYGEISDTEVTSTGAAFVLREGVLTLETYRVLAELKLKMERHYRLLKVYENENGAYVLLLSRNEDE